MNLRRCLHVEKSSLRWLKLTYLGERTRDRVARERASKQREELARRLLGSQPFFSLLTKVTPLENEYENARIPWGLISFVSFGEVSFKDTEYGLPCPQEVLLRWLMMGLNDLLRYVTMFLVNSILKKSGIVPADDAMYQVGRMIWSAFFTTSNSVLFILVKCVAVFFLEKITAK